MHITHFYRCKNTCISKNIKDNIATNKSIKINTSQMIKGRENNNI